MLLLALFVGSQVFVGAQDALRTYQVQARTFDRFMMVVDAAQRIDPTDETALDRLASDLTRERPTTLAQAYLARLVLVGADNARLERGIRGEIGRVGVEAILTRLRDDRRYADNLPGVDAAVADMRTFAAGVVARTKSAADRLEGEYSGGSNSGGGDVGENARMLLAAKNDAVDVVLGSIQAVYASQLKLQQATTSGAAVDAVAVCMTSAATTLEECTDAAMNMGEKALCMAAYMLALTACTAMP